MKGSGGANSRGKESKEDGRGCRLTQGENHWIYHLSCLLFFYSMIRCSPLTPKNEEMMEKKLEGNRTAAVMTNESPSLERRTMLDGYCKLPAHVHQAPQPCNYVHLPPELENENVG